MEDAQHLYDLIKGFETAMLVTRAADGHLHARPMVVAELRADADAYFVTSIDSPKVAEIYADADVLLTLQGEHQYAAVYGRANVEHDRAQIARLWQDAWKTWFPRGASDPAIALLRFDAEHGEFWNDAGMSSVRYEFEGARAHMTSAQPVADGRRPGHAH